MAEAIKLFSKSLTNTDNRKRLAIPTKILPALPDFNGNHSVKLNLLYGTKTWPIVCSVRKNGYKKPVFSGGWRNFVICNNFSVGDELTLYKVIDEAGSSYYRVEVEKPAKPFEDLSPRAVSCLTEIPNFEYEQKSPSADAPIKEKGAVMELAYVSDGDVSAPFVDEVIISKPPCLLFGTNLSDETTSKAQFKPEQEPEMKFSNICKGESPQHHSCYNMSKEENLDLTLAPLSIVDQEAPVFGLSKPW